MAAQYAGWQALPGAPLTADVEIDQVQAIPSFSQNISTLTQGLRFNSEQEFVDWFCSPLFQAHWEVYSNEYLKPARERAAQQNKRLPVHEDVTQVIQAIHLGESFDQCKYSNVFGTRKHDWQPIDHMAFFLYHCTRENLEDWDGALYEKGFGLNLAYHAIWQVLSWLMRKIQPSEGGYQEVSGGNEGEEHPLEKDILSLLNSMSGWNIS